MKVLFWNTQNKPAAVECLGRLAGRWSADVIGLAECYFDPTELARRISRNIDPFRAFRPIYRGRKGLQLLARVPERFAPVAVEEEHYVIFNWSTPDEVPALLCLVHLQSQRYLSVEGQASLSGRVAQAVQEMEAKKGHRRSIVFGDFNMDPFDLGMLSFDGFHSTLYRDIMVRKKGERVFRRKMKPLFYNPALEMLQRRDEDVPGTYHYDRKDVVNPYWHIFDQMLIRDALMMRFDRASYRILDHDGERPLRNARGLPDPSVSDHLPIFFSVDLMEGAGDAGGAQSMGN